MNTDAVIGCDAVDAGDQWLRLRTASGLVRTFPWSAIKIAGMGGNHEGHVEIQGVTEKVTPYFATHDSLWIIYATGGFAQVMLEKSNPKREAILAACAQHLHIAWRGDDFTSSELTSAMFEMPVLAMKKFPLVMKIMLVFMVLSLLLGVIAAYVMSHRQ
jgi:hypothetical protein